MQAVSSPHLTPLPHPHTLRDTALMVSASHGPHSASDSTEIQVCVLAYIMCLPMYVHTMSYKHRNVDVLILICLPHVLAVYSLQRVANTLYITCKATAYSRVCVIHTTSLQFSNNSDIIWCTWITVNGGNF